MSGEIEAGSARRSGRRAARREAHDSGIRRIKCSQRAVHQADAGVERQRAEHRLGFCLEAVELGRIGIVELKTDHRFGRITDANLEIPEVVVKAVDLLRQTTGERRGAVVQLTKRIPTAAGLGGGSSDAAAALVAANLAWNCHLTTAELMGLAAQLGSDVPFFLAGAAAICRGRGEQIEPLDGLSGLNFVVVRPPEGLSTATVYRNCDISDCINADGLHTMTGLVEDLRRGDLSRAGKMFFNRLQSAAEKLSDWIKRLSDLFAAHSCLGHAMSGSGTSYFGLVATAAQARRLAGRLRSMGMGSAFVVRTC